LELIQGLFTSLNFKLFAEQKNRPPSRGTLPAHSFFAVLLAVFLILATALSYLSVLALGPVLEHMLFKILLSTRMRKRSSVNFISASPRSGLSKRHIRNSCGKCMESAYAAA
jgi:hypothetical protein